MSRSRRSCFVFTVAMVFFAAFGYAQIRNLPINRGYYSVKLTAASNNHGGVDLTTTVYFKDANAMASVPPTVVTDRWLRYTFSAKRTWPCADTQTVPTNHLTGQVTVHPYTTVHPVAGEYTGFSVHVYTEPSTLNTLPSVIGDASANTGYVIEPPYRPRDTIWGLAPPAGSKGPVQALISIAVPHPPEFTRFRFKIRCDTYCIPGEGTAEGTSNVYTLSTMIYPNSSGSWITLWARIDEIHITGCTWDAYWTVSKQGYYNTK